MPHVLAAWVRWAGRRQGLAAEVIAETLDAVFDSMGTFAQVYRDPTSFGLEPQLVARLLPDDDLEALPRRAFAFPVLRGMYGGIDLARLDPAQPADRRTLLAADHDDGNGRPSRRAAHRPAPGARRPALARRPAGAVGGGAAPAGPGRGPARGAAHADVRDQGRGHGLRRACSPRCGNCRRSIRQLSASPPLSHRLPAPGTAALRRSAGRSLAAAQLEERAAQVGGGHGGEVRGAGVRRPAAPPAGRGPRRPARTGDRANRPLPSSSIRPGARRRPKISSSTGSASGSNVSPACSAMTSAIRHSSSGV